MVDNNWLKIILVVGCVAGLMLALAQLQRKYKLHPEIARKAMHIGSGLVALSLPWLFQEGWPVFVLTLLATTGMVAVKYLNGLRENIGAVTGSVVRKTWGELCFPVGVGLLFAFAQGNVLLYSIPLLILTFADASAALIGVFYGVMRYTTADGTKTLEGSLAFFQAALLSTLTPLLLFTELGRTETLLIALLMGLLSMLLDAIAWWGLDNLLIPLLSFLALRSFMTVNAQTLTVDVVVTLVLLLFSFVWRKRTTLNDSAVLATAIYGYLCWTLGGWVWMLPPLILLVSYNVLSPRDNPDNQRRYTTPVVLSVGVVGLFWLILANVFRSQALYYPYMLSFAAQLAMISLARALRVSPHPGPLILLMSNIVISWLLLLAPFVFVYDLNDQRWLYALSALLCIGVGVGAFALTQRGRDGYRNTIQRWFLQALGAGLTSLIGLAIVQLF
jgi:phytol kinase